MPITPNSAVRPLHTTVIPVTDATGDGTVQLEMSVNPISVIYIRLRALNDTATLANYNDYFDLASALERIELSYRGQSIHALSGQDLVALNWLRWGILPEEANPNNVNNERREIVIPLILGSEPFSERSCFPATRRGDLVLRLQIDDADTGYDAVEYAVDTLEMLGARPSEFERRLTLARTNSATGQNDLDLVPRRVNRGVLLFGTTSFTGATPAPSLSEMRVLLDNQEVWYSGLPWQVLSALPQMWGRHRSFLKHKHSLNAAAAGITETLEVSTALAANWQRYGYLDFDVTKDDKYSLDTTNATRFQLRHTAGTADAVRSIQMEVVAPSDIGAQA